MSDERGYARSGVWLMWFIGILTGIMLGFIIGGMIGG